MYSRSPNPSQRGVGSVVDLTLSNVPRSLRDWGTANGFQGIEEQSFIQGRVDYISGQNPLALLPERGIFGEEQPLLAFRPAIEIAQCPHLSGMRDEMSDIAEDQAILGLQLWRGGFDKSLSL
jgi:hypothetical protein